MDLDLGIFLIHLIVLGLIIPDQGEVYYVTPTEPPNPECPGDPCHTIDFYIANEDTYFKDKTNLSLHLLRGIHNSTGKDSRPVILIKDLLTFLMIGAQNSNDVLVCFSIIFDGVDTAVIKNLMFSEYHCSNSQSITGTDSPRSLIIIDSSIQGIVLSFVHNSGENCRSVELIRSVFSSDVSVAFIFSKLINSIYFKQNQFKARDCVIQQNEFILTMRDGAIEIKECKFLDVNIQINAENGSIVLSDEVWFFHSHLTVIFASSSTVTMSGNTSFINILETPIIAYLSTISISGDCKFLNNSGKNGGALALHSSVLKIGLNTKLYFVNNSATDTGGALYVSGSSLETTVPAQYHVDINPSSNQNHICFYQLLEYSSNQAYYSVTFKENTAKRGGDHIYGASLSGACTAAYKYDNFLKALVAVRTSSVQRFFKLEPNLTTTMSPVTSNPRRVCVCDSDGKPQCAEMSKLFVSGLSVYPRETFTLSAAVVGADFGTTIGTIHANFPNTNLNQEHTSVLKPASQYSQWATSHEFCDRLVYSLYSRRAYQLMYLTAIDMASNAAMQYNSRDSAEIFIEMWYKSHRTIQPYLLNTPVFINITLLPCPLGFLLIGDPPGCECHPVLAGNDFVCEFLNKTGYLSWKGLVWVGTFDDTWNTRESNELNGLIVAYYCPPDYCKADYKSIDLHKYPDSQCIFNHAGRLCGGCRENYSLAIGSSKCISCSTNNYLTLLIFFSFAGVLLVLFICVLNLTVTQGMINGLIFYANIIWAYENLLFPQTETNIAVLFLKMFIAWLNLDFGIESCLFQDLNAFWKTLLQYVFPIYIWSIAGLIIISTRHSSLLTKIIGNRAVPVLTTLFLLSYMKLLRTTVSSIRFHIIYVFVKNHSRLVVWSLDGRYEYCHFPHLILFIAAISTMLLLWLPYTLLLLLIQWLRKVSHYRIFRWLTRFSPVYDAHFAPLKIKHQYWFGVLLLVRGILLVIFSATYTVLQSRSHRSAFALSYTNYKQIYKHKSVQILENLFLFALIPVGAAGLIGSEAKYIILYISIAFSFLIFCGIVVWSILKSSCCKVVNKNEEQIDDDDDSHLHAQLRNSNLGATEYTKFRDSILEEFTQPMNTNVNSTY